jgi:transcriptional regulator with XRE-family HTH domain
MSTSDLAEKAGVKKRTIDHWLWYKNPNPMLEDFHKIAEALGVSMEYLITGKDVSELTDEEDSLLVTFRGLPKNKRALLARIAEVMAE